MSTYTEISGMGKTSPSRKRRKVERTELVFRRSPSSGRITEATYDVLECGHWIRITDSLDFNSGHGRQHRMCRRCALGMPPNPPKTLED